jgi:Flp pilus assembly protein TadG
VEILTKTLPTLSVLDPHKLQAIVNGAAKAVVDGEASNKRYEQLNDRHQQLLATALTAPPWRPPQ